MPIRWAVPSGGYITTAPDALSVSGRKPRPQYGQYAYDALDRLISARLPEGSYGSAFDYAYDKAGNRIRQTMGGEARVHTIDTDSNRLLGMTGRRDT